MISLSALQMDWCVSLDQTFGCATVWGLDSSVDGRKVTELAVRNETSVGATQMSRNDDLICLESAGQWVLRCLTVYFLHSGRQKTADIFNDSRWMFLFFVAELRNVLSAQLCQYLPWTLALAERVGPANSTSLNKQVIIRPRESTNMYFLQNSRLSAEILRWYLNPHASNEYIICEYQINRDILLNYSSPIYNRDWDQDAARIRNQREQSSELWRSQLHFKPPINSQRCFNQFSTNEAWAERLGPTSVIEEAQVRQYKPPLLPQFHSCAVLKTHQIKTVTMLDSFTF